jgi:hypothetical protein
MKPKENTMESATLDLNIEALDPIEAPLSDEFWTGFVGGIGVGAAVFAVLT